MNDITAVIAEMRARRINHGKFDSPTLQAWANRIEVAAAEANLCRHMWERTMDMAAPAMDYVQRNADKFGAQVGDDRLEIVCREFLRSQVGGDRFGPELDRLLTDAYNAGTEGADLDLIAARKALAATGKQQVDPSWSLHDRVEFALRDAGFDFDEASRIALQVDGKQQVGEAQGDVPDPAVIVPTLRAMVRNYSDGHRWDHLDARMCQAAADRIETLEAAIAARHPVRTVNADEAPFGLTTAEKVAWAQGANDAIKEYGALPAQGIDLGQLRSLLVRINDDENGDSYHNLSCAALDLIDQRDAAPGA